MRPEKELLKKEIRGKIERFPSFAIVQYSKLSANAANDLRRQIGKLGGDIEIVRKRVLLKASEEVGLALDPKDLPGHIGLIFFGEDPIESTKVVFKFSKERDKAIEVVGGRFEGRLYSGADIERLSTLPNKDEMRAQLLSTLEAPLSQTLAVIEALLTSIPHCLENRVKKDETVGEEAVVEA